jgi:hypothetical protein
MMAPDKVIVVAVAVLNAKSATEVVSGAKLLMIGIEDLPVRSLNSHGVSLAASTSKDVSTLSCAVRQSSRLS